MAAEVQSFFEKRTFTSCLNEIKEKITTPSNRRDTHPVKSTGSREQTLVELKENNKENQKPVSKEPRKIAAASPKKHQSFKERLIHNLGMEGAKKAIDYWGSLTQRKQESIRNPVGYLTDAIRKEWDKENVITEGEERKTLESAQELNKAYALKVNECIKPLEVKSYIGKDYLEFYNGTWNQIILFSESHESFQNKAEITLKKLGVSAPSRAKEEVG